MCTLGVNSWNSCCDLMPFLSLSWLLALQFLTENTKNAYKHRCNNGGNEGCAFFYFKNKKHIESYWKCFLCCRYRLQVLDEYGKENIQEKRVPLSSPLHCRYSQSRTAHWRPLLGSPASPSQTAETQQHIHTSVVSHSKAQNSRVVSASRQTSSSLRALSHSFWPGACWVHMVMSWLMLSVTALWMPEEKQRSRVRRTEGEREWALMKKTKTKNKQLLFEEDWPSSSGQLVLEIGGARVCGQGLGC